jgi:chaperonin GroEL
MGVKLMTNKVYRDVVFSGDARSEIKKGVDTLADAVKVTLGPRGRNASIEGGYGVPLITKDGVTVARSIHLKDRVQNMGAQLVKSVASRTNSVAGDGTTTATVLAQAIYSEGYRMIELGYNPILLKKGIDKAVSFAVSELDNLSVKVSDLDSIKSVATISANNDEELGSLIAQVVSAVGEDGLINVENGSGETKVEYSSGFSLDRGLLDPAFITNNQTLSSEFSNCFVFLYNGTLDLTKGLISSLQTISEERKPVLFVARGYSEQCLNTFIHNNSSGALKCAVIKSPGFGDVCTDMMNDLAILTGGKLFSETDITDFSNFSVKDLGFAKKIISSRSETKIIDGAGSEQSILERVEDLKHQLSLSDNFDHEFYSMKQRISSLTGGVAIIKAGGLSDAEVRETRDRIEDAVNAVKAALDDGIVSGGGSSLLHLVNPLLKHKETLNLTSEESTGFDILVSSIKAPFIQIMKNAGADYHLIMDKIIESDNNLCGYNALTLEWESDMISAGVIDPVKVTKAALKNSSSASGILMTTEVAITVGASDD